jgi:hypothetical protein
VGYTHYWENGASVIPDAALVIMRELLDRAFAAGIVQQEFDDPRPPEVTAARIRFNGVGDLGHETFCFDVADAYRTDSGRPFAFCKTNQKPYDAVVMRVLIVLKVFLKEAIRVTSDGGFAEEWQDARDELAARYGLVTYVAEELVVAEE